MSWKQGAARKWANIGRLLTSDKIGNESANDGFHTSANEVLVGTLDRVVVCKCRNCGRMYGSRCWLE